MIPIIRLERPEDCNQIYKVTAAAFEQDNEARLVDLLRKGESFIPELSLVAEIEKHIVGHILLTYITITQENGERDKLLSLAPMSVLPEWQNKGIGSQLVKESLRRAKKLGHKAVIVLGHDKYYPRFGFKPASKWNIHPPFPVSSEFFLALELIPGALTDISGTVTYPKEFEAV